MQDGNIEVVTYLGKHSRQAGVNLVTAIFCSLGTAQGAVIGGDKVRQVYQLGGLGIGNQFGDPNGIAGIKMIIRRRLKANPALPQNLNQILGRRAVSTDNKELQINYLPGFGHHLTTEPLNFGQRRREVKCDGGLREFSN